jgi:hypothetical protein
VAGSANRTPIRARILALTFRSLSPVSHFPLYVGFGAVLALGGRSSQGE